VCRDIGTFNDKLFLSPIGSKERYGEILSLCKNHSVPREIEKTLEEIRILECDIKTSHRKLKEYQNTENVKEILKQIYIYKKDIRKKKKRCTKIKNAIANIEFNKFTIPVKKTIYN
tara:strand:+ start:216 stop:563 length:348 start_codon:yes stop_codon:yes gene_type:complete